MLDEHLVEFAPEDLPALGDGFAVVAIEEIERLTGAPVGGHELNAELFDEVALLHPGDESESFERAVGEGNERFADVIAGKFFPFENQHTVAGLGQQAG